MPEFEPLRTYTSKTFKNADGTSTLRAHAGHIHYKDLLGNFTDVDYTFEDMGAYWRMTKASYRLYIAKDFGASQLIRFDNKYEGRDHTIYYEPHSIWYVDKTNPNTRIKIRDAQSVTGVLSGKKITYTNAFGNGIDFEITLLRSGFKKEIVIPANMNLNPPANHVPVVLFRYQADGLTLKAEDGQDWDADSYYESEEGFTVRESVTQYRSYIRRAYIEDSAPSPTRQKLKIFWEKRNGSLWQAKVIPLNFLTAATYPVRLDTTTSYYSGAGDGRVNEGGNATWAGTHDATTGNNVNYTNDTFTVESASEGGPNYYTKRAFIPIDTSAIPDAATISAATLELYAISTVDDDNDTEAFLAVCETFQASTSELATGDYEDCGSDNGTAARAKETPIEVGSDEIDISTITTSAYNTFTLNATGLGWINKTGITQIGVREGHDLEDNAIAYTGSTLTSRADFSSSEETAGGGGQDQDPYLEVTYTANTTITCDTGAYAVTGSTMTPLATRLITCATGTYAYTGSTMTPLAARYLACATGVYAHTGATMTPTYNENVTITPAVYSVVMTFRVSSILAGVVVYGGEIRMFMDLSMN